MGNIYQVDPLRGRAENLALLNARLSCEPLIIKDKLYACLEDGRMMRLDLRSRALQEFAPHSEMYRRAPGGEKWHDHCRFTGSSRLCLE